MLISKRIIPLVFVFVLILSMLSGCLSSSFYTASPESTSSDPSSSAATSIEELISPSSDPHSGLPAESPAYNDSSALPAGSSSADKSSSLISSSAKPANSNASSAASSIKPTSSTANTAASSAASSVSSVSSQASSSQQASSAPASQPVNTAPSGEMRAVWVSYLELDRLLKGKNQSEFTSNFSAVLDNMQALGLNTVIAQVRPFGDALYNSSVFPWSSYVSGTQGTAPSGGFDPLSVMISLTKARGMKIHAWINPYRIRTSSKNALSADNPAQKWLNDSTRSNNVLSFNDGLFYNPAEPEVRKLICDGVAEIVRGYDVNGIHFDDYFYPTTEKSFDQQSFSASGTNMTLGDWRRENVNTLIRDVYATVKGINPSVEFGVSPQGNLKIDYEQQYADCVKWGSTPGYVDYLCPQIYYGFKNAAQPFSTVLDQWNTLSKQCRLYIGLSPYKIGQTDKYAGTGSSEWINETEILARQVSEARGKAKYGGFSLYRYDSVFLPASGVKAQVDAEYNALKKLLS